MLIPLDTVETIYYNEVIYKETLKKDVQITHIDLKTSGVFNIWTWSNIPHHLFLFTYFNVCFHA